MTNPYHAKYFAHDLTRHMLEATLFALDTSLQSFAVEDA